MKRQNNDQDSDTYYNEINLFKV